VKQHIAELKIRFLLVTDGVTTDNSDNWRCGALNYNYKASAIPGEQEKVKATGQARLGNQ